MTSLSVLQNRMKRDPGPYVDDFVRQLSHFEAMRTLLIEQTTPQSNKEAAKQFGKLAAFLAATASCYPEKGGKKIADLIISLLENHAALLLPDLRLKLLQSLILLRVKGLLGPEKLIEACFSLFKVRDKPFRAALYSYIVKDVRVINKLKANVELNKQLQSLVFRMLSDDERTAGTPAAAKRALSVVIELYKRRVWTDSRAVNVVADACFSRIPRNAVAAARFFLGIDDEIDDLLNRDEEDEDDGNPMNVGTRREERAKALRSSLSAPKVSKQTKSKMRKRTRAKAQLRKINEGSDKLQAQEVKTSEAKRLIAPRFPAIDLIHDPQTFVERLLKTVRASSDRFEVRLVQMNLISRVVGHHKLQLFPFYSFCQKYLQPHHENVNSVLACVIQASHSLVPPDEIEPLIKLLANNFINDRTGSEVVAVGLNAVRELISRVPLLTEGDGMKDLLSDLIAYRKYRRDRSVIISARSLLLELRRINPKVLAAKERGKFHNIENKPLEFGAEKVSDGVDGVDLLEQWLSKTGGGASEAGDDVELDDEDEDEHEGEEEEGDEEDDDDEDSEDEDEGEEDGEDEDATGTESRSVKSGTTNGDGSKRLRLDAARILTDEDFKRIRTLQKLQSEGKLKSTKEQNAKRHRGKIMGYTIAQEGDDEDDENEDGDKNDWEVASLGSSSSSGDSKDEEKPYDPSILDPKSLDGVKKKNRRELAEKLEAIKLQNEAKKIKRNSRIVNNTEKAKRTKDFLMVQKSHGVKKKQTLSIREQQAGVAKHIKSLRNKSKLLTKMRRKG